MDLDGAGAHWHGVSWMYTCVGPLSLLGSLFILITYLRHPSVRSPNTQMVFCMSACYFLFVAKGVASSVMDLAGLAAVSRDGTVLCTSFGLVGQVFGLGAVVWSGAIAVNLWCTLRWPFRYKASRYLWLYHVVVWSFSTLSGLVVLLFDQVGFSGDGTCWIKGSRNPWRATFFVPLIVAWLTCFLVLLSLLCSDSGKSRSSGLQKTRLRAARRLSRFVLVFVLCWVVAMAARVWEYAIDAEIPIWAVMVEAACNSCVGLANGVLWGVALRRLWKKQEGSSSSSFHTSRHDARATRGSGRRGVTLTTPRGTRLAAQLSSDGYVKL